MSAVAPGESTTPIVSRTQSLRAPVLMGAAGILGLAALHFRDPHEATWVLCPFNTLTGLPCPGCGGLRAMNLLSHGDLGAAVSSNLLAVLLVPVVAVAWIIWFVRRARGNHTAQLMVLSNTAMIVVSVLVTIFWISRLTPWGAWLAP